MLRVSGADSETPLKSSARIRLARIDDRVVRNRNTKEEPK